MELIGQNKGFDIEKTKIKVIYEEQIENLKMVHNIIQHIFLTIISLLSFYFILHFIVIYGKEKKIIENV